MDRYKTLEEGGLVLHILTPTDSVRDRLASFFWYHDRSALAAACGVAIACGPEIDLVEIKAWATREGESKKVEEFLLKLEVT